jgi:hypothetical protein
LLSWDAFVGFVGEQFMTCGLTAEIPSFGTFLGFPVVLVATVWQFCIVNQTGRLKNFFGDALIRRLGGIFRLAIWWGLHLH